MKRKRGRKPGKKSAPAAPAAAAEEAASPEESSSSPSTDAANTPEDQVEDEASPVAPAAEPAVPEPTPPPPPPPPSEPPQKPTAPSTHADITYNKPKVGAVYGRVKLKFKSSKPVEPPKVQSSSEAQAPAADAGKPGNAAVPEVIPEVAADKVTVVTDGQQTEGHAPEMSSSDKEKVMVRKVGAIKIKSAGLPSSSPVVVVVENNSPDRKADAEDDSPPSKMENVSENKETEDAAEPRSSQESEEKQSTPERRRDEKELAAALEAIKKVMKMDAAEPFNVPVDPVALGIPDYFDIIDTPMDFGTICQNLEEGNKYMNSEDVYKDVQFIWDNCTKYNSKGDYIIELMKRVKKGFMKNWLAAGLYSDMPESGGNDNMGDEDAKSQSKSKSKNKRRHPGNDRHKSDCACAVCQVTRRKKEKDEILAVIDTETTVMDQHNLEVSMCNLKLGFTHGNSGAYNPGSHDTSSSQEQPPQTDMYKEAAEANDSDIQMEDLGKFSGDRPSSLLYPGYEDEGSRQYSDRKEGIEYRDVNSQEEHTPSQPYEYSEAEHHQKAQMESSPEEVEMEDYPVQQENPSFMQLCASLFPSNQSSIFRGRHSLFRRQRRAPLKEGPLHAAIAAIMKQ
ncbi:hypothetical protein PR202_ga30950 [Eleusine coracana subsp. coracana]|uniref:Bromo domain-containing protein n=1 Tax=Eleusine coracana subsp. coracana TaxID=191504 RepID=A0AAV5DRW7_ELECO|nr:hypothetical protein PR202_ga30950 [Eleusine coracana subsp. coracana]